MKHLHGNVDAEVWANEFIKHVQAGLLDPTKLEDVRAWFANAIMAGHDRGKPVNGDHAAYLLEQETELRKKIQ